MRKWMRDKLKRRKKPQEEAAPAQAPLQPAYFEPQEAPAAEAEREPAAESATVEAPSADAEPESASADAQPETGGGAGNAAQRPRRRRGRGGRGRRRPGQSPTATGRAAAPADEAALAPAASRPASSATAHASKGVVVLAIGLPGSGKSSWFKRNNITPLSSDMIRALLFDNPEEQRFQDLVFSNLRSMLRARLVARRPMNYVDATNLTPHERDSWIKLAKDYGYEAQALYFDVPLELCLERNQRRQRAVSEDIMCKMAAKLKAPAFEEGFSKITVVRVKQKE